MYSYKFLSRGFTGRREILHGSGHISDRSSPIFEGIASGMAKFWALMGAIWWYMLLAGALVGTFS